MFTPGHDLVRQNPFAEQYLKRVGNLVNFTLTDPVRGPLVKIVGAATGPVDDGSNSQFGMLTIDEKQTVDGDRWHTTRTEQMDRRGLDRPDLERYDRRMKAQTDYNMVGLLLKYVSFRQACESPRAPSAGHAFVRGEAPETAGCIARPSLDRRASA